MSKAVLISIKPEWCGMIALGEKTIEIRKTKPKLEVPFKCYIYCTKAKNKASVDGYTFFTDELYVDYYSKIPTCGHTQFEEILNGKVIGEFVCDRIHRIAIIDDECVDVVDCNTACLSSREILDYANGNPLYGWHISNLVIYDKPKELSEFYKECGGVDDTGLCYECDKAVGEECDCSVHYELHLTRPPQSWCYVEEN